MPARYVLITVCDAVLSSASGVELVDRGLWTPGNCSTVWRWSFRGVIIVYQNVLIDLQACLLCATCDYYYYYSPQL
jgi:hypothetical protein